jgi:hypothetical protein
MIKGCVYTCGSPQYLSAKFGTEFKIDVGLFDESDETENKCTEWFESQLPDAELNMVRPKSRIYSVPANKITLSDLFEKMESAKQSGEGGFDYYTCSSSSLERVFMEIVKISEQEDLQVHNLGGAEKKKSHHHRVSSSSSDILIEP